MERDYIYLKPKEEIREIIRERLAQMSIKYEAVIKEVEDENNN